MSTKKELIVKQVRFWVLMAGGSTLTAACEAAGVHRATGRKWRQAAGGLIPRQRPVLSGRYLSLEERLQIADLRLGGAGVRAIAVGIGRSPATGRRELRRNGSAATPRSSRRSWATPTSSPRAATCTSTRPLHAKRWRRSPPSSA
jgi:IS30 family transposase